MTKGEYLVGINFNPSEKSEVDNIKRASADLIDMIERIPDGSEFPSERKRLKALAITNIENGAMWGVKAATKQKPSEEN